MNTSEKPKSDFYHISTIEEIILSAAQGQKIPIEAQRIVYQRANIFQILEMQQKGHITLTEKEICDKYSQDNKRLREYGLTIARTAKKPKTITTDRGKKCILEQMEHRLEIYHDNEEVGYLEYEITSHSVHINQIYCHERGKGYCNSLMAEIERIAARKKKNEVTLDVELSATELINMYTKKGFEVRGRNKEDPEFFVMVKKLVNY